MKRLFATLACLISSLPNLPAKVDFSLSVAPDKISAGEVFKISAKFDISEGSHIYYKTAPETGLPTSVDLQLPSGFKLENSSWQKPEEFSQYGQKYSGYANSAAVEFSVRAPEDFLGAAEISAKAAWLECADTCMPADAEAKVRIEILPAQSTAAKDSDAKISSAENSADGANGLSRQNSAERQSAFSSAEKLSLILGAFLGGLILNLMPCVFPVLGLKILSFAKSAGQNRRKILMNALMYAAGIVASFWLLAGLLLALKFFGRNLGWGFQLQNPVFVAIMAALFLAIALNLFGVFEVGAKLAAAGTNAQIKTSKLPPALSSFLSGVLAVAVASPCTAPFMGTALGAAFAQNSGAVFAFSIFASLGAGMSLPYLAISAFPQAAKLLPKPGAWMETFKQILSFPMFAAVIWLIYVFLLQTNAAALTTLLLCLLAMFFALYIYGRFTGFERGGKTRACAKVFSALILAGALFGIVLSARESSSESSEKAAQTDNNAWSQERLDELLKEGKIVYVDFTASWCLTCQANKAAIFSATAKDAFKRNNATMLVGDWTKRSEKISAELKKFGRVGVPLNLVYSPKRPDSPEILPALLTPEIVAKAIDKAAR